MTQRQRREQQPTTHQLLVYSKSGKTETKRITYHSPNARNSDARADPGSVLTFLPATAVGLCAKGKDERTFEGWLLYGGEVH